MMRTTTRFLSAGVVCLVLLWPEAATAQSRELLDATERSDALYEAGRYAEAQPFAETALALVEREFGPDRANTAAVLSNLAEIFQVQGSYAEAEPLCKRALAIWAQVRGPAHPNAATGPAPESPWLRSRAIRSSPPTPTPSRSKNAGR